MGSLAFGLSFIALICAAAVVAKVIDSVLWLVGADRMYNKALLSVVAFVGVVYVVVK